LDDETAICCLEKLDKKREASTATATQVPPPPPIEKEKKKKMKKKKSTYDPTKKYKPNAKCHCGSGQKYKKCCRALDQLLRDGPKSLCVAAKMSSNYLMTGSKGGRGVLYKTFKKSPIDYFGHHHNSVVAVDWMPVWTIGHDSTMSFALTGSYNSTHDLNERGTVKIFFYSCFVYCLLVSSCLFSQILKAPAVLFIVFL